MQLDNRVNRVVYDEMVYDMINIVQINVSFIFLVIDTINLFLYC